MYLIIYQFGTKRIVIKLLSSQIYHLSRDVLKLCYIYVKEICGIGHILLSRRVQLTFCIHYLLLNAKHLSMQLISYPLSVSQLHYTGLTSYAITIASGIQHFPSSKAEVEFVCDIKLIPIDLY